MRPKKPVLVFVKDPKYVSPRTAGTLLEASASDIQRLVKNGHLTEFRTPTGRLRLSLAELLETKGRRKDVMDDRPLRASEAARLLGVDPTWVARLARAGKLRFYTVPFTQERRFKRSDVLQLKREREAKSERR